MNVLPPCPLIFRRQDSIGCYENGKIYLHEDLLEMTDNPSSVEILKFVIGHEHGHHICRTRSMFESKCKIMAILKRRKEEYWCDMYAYENYSRIGGIRMFRRLIKNNWKDWLEDKLLGWCHPSSRSRIERLNRAR